MYATDEQRSQAGCIGVQDWHRYSVTGPERRRGAGPDGIVAAVLL